MDIKLQCQLEEFKDMRHNAFIKALELKSEGKHIAGIYGVNIPREILWAMDIVPINIFGIDGSNIEAAEKYMDKESCSLLKASYGYVITDRCPFSHFADIIVGTDYCSDKERMIYKLENIKKTYIIKEHKNEHDLMIEYENFIYFLQQEFSVRLDEDKLVSVVEKINAVSKLIREITDIYMHHPDMMGCDDLRYIIYGSQFIFDLDERLDKLCQLRDTLDSELPESAPVSKGSVLITGAPLAVLNDEITEPLSSVNKAVIALSCCEGENYNIVNEGRNLYSGLARKYLAESCHENLDSIISEYKIETIINADIKGCRGTGLVSSAKDIKVNNVKFIFP